MAPKMTSTQMINSLYEAFQRGDIARILSMVAPQATWRQSSAVPWGGDYRGPEGAAEFFKKLDAAMETVGFEVRENVEHGDEVFSFGIYKGRSRATGRIGEAEWMFRWRLQGGQVVAFDSYTDTAPLVAALATH
jgi:ketosteroid isomerase-like protein